MTEIEIIEGGSGIDDRGIVSFINDFDFQEIKRFYQVQNHNIEVVRAFHGHKKEIKYVYVPKGTAMIIAVSLSEFYENNNKPALKKFILSDRKPSILKIPSGYANGFRMLEKDSIIQFFSNKTLKESLKDDIRYAWDFFGKNIWETMNR
jgi:dTDP-4-dehydrorhamnose 3,5-epimerase